MCTYFGRLVPQDKCPNGVAIHLGMTEVGSYVSADWSNETSDCLNNRRKVSAGKQMKQMHLLHCWNHPSHCAFHQYYKVIRLKVYGAVTMALFSLWNHLRLFITFDLQNLHPQTVWFWNSRQVIMPQYVPYAFFFPALPVGYVLTEQFGIAEYYFEPDS